MQADPLEVIARTPIDYTVAFVIERHPVEDSFTRKLVGASLATLILWRLKDAGFVIERRGHDTQWKWPPDQPSHDSGAISALTKAMSANGHPSLPFAEAVAKYLAKLGFKIVQA
jgi:hypothetical protein